MEESIDGDLTNNNGIHDYWIVILAATTHIADNHLASDIHVYPNPSYHRINVSWRGIGVFQLQIFDVLGNKVLDKGVSGSRTVINLQSMGIGKGSCSIRLLDGDGGLVGSKQIIYQ